MKNKKDFKLYRLVIVGHLMINLPIIIISFGLPLFMALWIDKILFKIIAGTLGFAIGISISSLLWSFLITKWRLWAFNKVEERDLITLKELAIKHKLIGIDGSKYEKTEIRTQGENEKLDSISEQIFELEQIEEIKLDLRTPGKIGYKLSKRENLIESFSMMSVLLVAIGMLFTEIHIFSIVIFLFLLTDLKNLKYLGKSFSSKDYLVLSNQGIQIGFKHKDFIRWEDIEKIVISRENRNLSIEFDNLGEKIKFDLWRLDSYNYVEFSKYLKVFIERYKLKFVD